MNQEYLCLANLYVVNKIVVKSLNVKSVRKDLGGCHTSGKFYVGVIALEPVGPYLSTIVDPNRKWNLNASYTTVN